MDVPPAMVARFKMSNVFSFLKVISFFVLGFAVFWFLNIRVGPHTQEVGLVGAQHALDTALSHCNQISSDRTLLVRCLRKQFVSMVNKWGVHAFMLALEKREARALPDDVSRTRCHDITHQIGEAGSRAQTIDTVLTSCTGLCQAGCYHGAVAGLIAQGKDLVAELSTFCLQSGLSPDAQYSCFHGVGHALGEIDNHTLTEKLHYCDTYPAFGKPPCGAGVFMQLYEFVPLSPTAVLSLPADRPGWCAQFWAPYDEICYSMSGIFEYAHTGNFAQAVAVCKKEPLVNQQSCIIDTGKSQFFSFPYTTEQMKKAENFCHSYADTWYSQCMTGILYNSPK